MDPVILWRFPFLRESADFVRSRAPDLETLLTSEAYSSVRDAGLRRVLAALGEGVKEEKAIYDDLNALNEILSYLVAKMIVSAIRDSYIIRRFALNEAGMVRAHLLGSSETTFQSLAEDLGLDFSIEDGNYTIHFSDYLRIASDRIGGPGGEWRLVNRLVDSGRVFLNKKEAIRLIMEAVRIRIEEELPLPVNDLICSALSREIERVKHFASKERKEGMQLGSPEISYAPPCMRSLYADAKGGVNMPHHARFALTTFLHAINMSETEILSVFASSPDFDERIARYQVEHITGISSGTEYSVPKCATMRSYGLCRSPDDLCSHVLHPLSYYRIRRRRWSFRDSLAVASALDGKSYANAIEPKGGAVIDEFNDNAVGKWIEIAAVIRDLRIKSIKLKERRYVYALPAAKSLNALPVLNWDVIFSLLRNRGKECVIRGFVTSLNGKPAIWIAGVKDA